MDTSPLHARLTGHTSTIFSEMTALAVANDAINLGQGAPDFSGPKAVTEAAVAAIRDGRNQYAPGPGIPTLRSAIAEHQSRFHGLAYDPDDEVTVTAGATEAIAAAVLSLCGPGDEVVAFAPSYDSYPATVAMAGARYREVPLRAPEWGFDHDEFRATVGPATRLLILNTPHNPTGHVFTRDELLTIAEVCVEHDVIVMTDEVYEHLVFDGHEHISLAAMPGMRERTIVVSSAGKTFSVTGWKVGWACASPLLTDAFRAAKMWLTFTNATPFQHAIAEALRLPDAFFEDYVVDYADRRQVLLDAASEHGLDIAAPQGTYFALLDVTQLGAADGLQLCRQMPASHGVAAIPTQVFHLDPSLGQRWIRLAFCKDRDAIRDGIARLASIRT